MRRMWRLTDRDNTNAWVIPNLIEEELATPYRVALLGAVAADGAFDLHGDQRAPEAAGRASVQCKIIAASASALQTAIDNMRNGVTGSVRNSGLRKLWR